MTAIEARELTNKGAESLLEKICKAIDAMIEQECSVGKYEIYINEENLPGSYCDMSITYKVLDHYEENGFKISFNRMNCFYTISWKEKESAPTTEEE